ncbi:MAG: FMN reductase (NADPH) [Chloroflexi bacterium ADurb.Bin325]|nr:MAG: FMN reductase (NADPH) [Chloroflexi bacterium ADurb.Bin325]
MTDVLDFIFRRRSIRQYTEQPIAAETMTRLLQAAMAAPSAANGRPWEFVAVTDPHVLAELRQALPGHYNGQGVIVVCCNLGLASSPASERFWQQDLSAATQNILLAAAALGLGSVWTGAHPAAERMAIIRRVLHIPEAVTPLSLIWLGHPAEEKPPRTQYDEARVHWQRYSREGAIIDELA